MRTSASLFLTPAEIIFGIKKIAQRPNDDVPHGGEASISLTMIFALSPNQSSTCVCLCVVVPCTRKIKVLIYLWTVSTF